MKFLLSLQVIPTILILMSTSLFGMDSLKIAATPGAIHALLLASKIEFEKISETKIELIELNSSEALRLLEIKEVDFAVSDSSLNEWMNSSRSNGVVIKNHQNLKIHHLGKSAFQIYVNKKLDRQEIDGLELKYLLTGNKKNIQNDDGISFSNVQLITAISLKGQEATLQHELTNDQNIEYNIKKINLNSVIVETENNVNAMFFGPMNLKLKGLNIKTIKSPLIVRPVFGISSGGEKEALKQFIQLLELKQQQRFSSY